MQTIINFLSIELALVLLVIAITGLVLYKKYGIKKRRVVVSTRALKRSVKKTEPKVQKPIQKPIKEEQDDSDKNIEVLLNPLDDIEVTDPQLDTSNPLDNLDSTQKLQVDMFAASEAELKETSAPKKGTKDKDEFIVFNLHAADDNPYLGETLFKLLHQNKLRFGASDIFHYHPSDNSEAWFKVANGVKPGTFDYVNQQQFSTPVLCFILLLNTKPSRPQGFHIAAFNQLIKTIHILQGSLGGRILDGDINEINEQGIEHYRQKVHEFERQILISNQTID